MLVNKTSSIQLRKERRPLLSSQAYKQVCFRTGQGTVEGKQALTNYSYLQGPQKCWKAVVKSVQKKAFTVKGANTGLINMLSATH